MSMPTIPARQELDESLRPRAAGQLVHSPSGVARKPAPNLHAGDEERKVSPGWWPLRRGADTRGRNGRRLDVVALEPRIEIPAPSAAPSRVAELEQVVWEQSLALIARCTQLADLCNKHQQQKDELVGACSEIMRLERLEAEARRQSEVLEFQTQKRIEDLEAQLEAERRKSDEAKSTSTELRRRLLDAEAKLNDAHVLVVMAAERAAAKERELQRISEQSTRLKMEVDLQSKAHRAEVDRLRSFHIACINDMRSADRPWQQRAIPSK